MPAPRDRVRAARYPDAIQVPSAAPFYPHLGSEALPAQTTLAPKAAGQASVIICTQNCSRGARIGVYSDNLSDLVVMARGGAKRVHRSTLCVGNVSACPSFLVPCDSRSANLTQQLAPQFGSVSACNLNSASGSCTALSWGWCRQCLALPRDSFGGATHLVVLAQGSSVPSTEHSGWACNGRFVSGAQE